MRDALARARRFRSRAQEFQRLADTCGSPEFARHYYLISKHFLALAHLEEDQVTAPSEETAPAIAPGSSKAAGSGEWPRTACETWIRISVQQCAERSPQNSWLYAGVATDPQRT